MQRTTGKEHIEIISSNYMLAMCYRTSGGWEENLLKLRVMKTVSRRRHWDYTGTLWMTLSVFHSLESCGVEDS